MNTPVPVLWIPASFVVGIAIGIFIMITRRHLRPGEAAQVSEIPPPLDPDTYSKVLAKIDEGYLAAMSQYDRLVPWASGGALVVSMSFVGSFAAVAPPWTKWVLGLAWLFLTSALLSSILSQYASTRIKVWSRAYVKARQQPPDISADQAERDNWRRNALGLDIKKRRNQKLTKTLNVLAGVLLTLGLLALGAFAVLAVPFGAQLTSE